MKGVFIFLGLVLLVIVIVAVVIINKDSPIDPIVLDPIEEPEETIQPNPEQTIQPENQIDLDMNNLEAECDSPTIKCTTEGCVTQC